jgi:hypothetical protein
MRLHRRWLVIARFLWIALVILILLIFFAGIPALYRQMQTACLGGDCISFQLSQEDARALEELGFSLTFNAWYVTAVALFGMLAFLLTAAGILWRQPHNPMAIFVSFWLVLVFPSFLIPVMAALVRAHSDWYWPVTLVQALSIWFSLLFGYLFPDGRFVPRWARPLLVIITAYALLLLFFTSVLVILRPVTAVDRMLRLLYWSLVVTGLVAQIYRYRRVSGPIERQQTKWVLFGLTVFVLYEIGWGVGVWPLIFPALRHPGSARVLYRIVGGTLNIAFLLLSLLFLAIAILRYRLFDIDILIRRTLIYSILTSALAAVYFCSVVLLQAFFRVLIGQASDVAIVASTLTIVVLFSPLRWRIQNLIDRRFYRRKYDTAKVLAAFGTRVRDETDLDGLRADLLRLLETTMQPQFVGLWLRDTPARGTTAAARPDSLPPG